MPRKVLITGATGNIGSQLSPRLAASDDLEARAFVHDENKASALREAGVECVIGSFEDAKSVGEAVDGIDTVVLITAPNAHAYDQAVSILAAAKSAGVRKIVRLSAIKGSPDGPTDNTRQHGRFDQELQSSGLTYVILRPHFYMQNLFMSAQTIGSEGNMYWGMGDGRLGIIDVRDIVDCAEAVVLSDQFDNQILSPTGPASISFHDVAKALTDALGRPVSYVPVSPEAVEQSLREMNMGDYFPTIMRDYSQAYSENWGDYVTEDVQVVTGHPARAIADFAREVLAPALKS